VYVAPDRPPFVAHRAFATNHQRHIDWEAFAEATASVDREQHLIARLDDATESASRFVQRFLEPPLYQSSFARGWGTLYTAVYEPASRRTALHWAGLSLQQSIDSFQEGAVTLSFGASPGAETRMSHTAIVDRRDNRHTCRPRIARAAQGYRGHAAGLSALAAGAHAGACRPDANRRPPAA
jgi:hypothetical protein